MGFEGKFLILKETIKMKNFNRLQRAMIVMVIIAIIIIADVISGDYKPANDYVFTSMEVVAANNPMDRSQGNSGQFALWKGEGKLLLTTHGGADGYIMSAGYDGDVEAAVKTALNIAVDGSSYELNGQQTIVFDRKLNINDINVIYVHCCYPGAHQGGSISIPYVVATGDFATSEDFMEEAFGDGREIGHKEVPIRIVGDNKNIAVSNGFYYTNGLSKKDITIYVQNWKVQVWAIQQYWKGLLG